MARRSLPIPDFLGGVSQQAAPQRFPNQLEAADNAWMSPADGLVKRQPFRHGALLSQFQGDLDRVLHPIERDSGERYVADITEDEIRVFDLDGTEFPVYADTAGNPADFSYLSMKRPGLISLPESLGSWTASAGVAAGFINMRPPYLIGSAQEVVATQAAAQTLTLATTAGVGGVGVTWTYAAHFRQSFGNGEGSATSDADLNLQLEFDDGLSGTARAVFAWNGTTDVLEAGATSWTNSTLGTITSAVLDLGGGWYRAVMTVETTTSDSVANAIIGVAGGAVGRGFAAFGAQLYRQFTDDPEQVPLYHVASVRGGISAATFQDTTFIANRGIVVDFEDTAIEALPPPSPYNDWALVWGRLGGFAQRYTIAVTYRDDTSLTLTTISAEVTTPLSDNTTALSDSGDHVATDATPEDIMAGFQSELDTAIGTDGDVLVNGAILSILLNTDFTLISVDAHDSLSNTGLVVMDESVPAIEDLPARSQIFSLRVAGRAGRSEDDFWVTFDRTDDSGGLSGDLSGAWVETGQPGLLTTLDEDTMPHVLVRRMDDQNGTATGTARAIYFTFEPYSWDDRLVGSEASNPSAALQGAQIGDIGFFRSRFYLITKRHVIFSEVDNPGNLFRTTVRQLLDSDPIHVEVPDSRVSALFRAIPLEDELTVFSDSAIYRVSGDPLLTPSSVQTNTAVELTLDPVSTPRQFGDTIIAFGRASDQTTVYEVLIASETRDIVRWADLSGPIPSYIPSRAAHSAASSASGTIAVVPLDEANALYVFQQYILGGGQRLQAAWFRYTFPEDATVISATFARRTLAMVIERNGQVSLEFADVQPLGVDGDLEHLVYLDRRLTEADLATPTYDSGSDTTTITLPYVVDADTIAVVDRSDATRATVASTGTHTVSVYGDWTASTFFVGELYDMTVTLTAPHYRVPDGTGRMRPFLGGPQRAISIALRYADSAHFQIVVAPPLRTENRLVWNSPLGTGAVLGPSRLQSGEARVYVLTTNQDAVVRIENPSPYPSRFLNGEWELDVHPRR